MINQFECDSGSRVSIMNINDFKQNKCINLKTDILFRSYTSDMFKPVGLVKLRVNYKDYSCSEELYLVNLKKIVILGRNWLRNLKIDVNGIVKQISIKNVKHCIDYLLKSYSDDLELRVEKNPDYEYFFLNYEVMLNRYF